MLNMNYDEEQPIGQLGQLVDRRDRLVESWAASEDIPFGRLVCRSNDPAKLATCRLPRLTTIMLVFAGDLVASNTVNGAINGEAIDPVVFASDHATTMAAVVAAIEELDTVKRAALDDSDTDDRTILVEVIDTDGVPSAWAVTGGAGQVAIDASVGTNLEQVLGVATFDTTRENPGTGGAKYKTGDMVAVVRRGHVWVPTVDDGDQDALIASVLKHQASAVFGGANAGKFATAPGAESEATALLENSRFTNFDVGDSLSAGALEINFPAAIASA